MPAIVAHELYCGAASARGRQRTWHVSRHFSSRGVSFDAEDARHAGAIRAHLTAAGTPIGPYDALIAGQARARRLLLVTHNVREFARVPGLQVEDWLAKTREN
ncbi:PIN domain-containing protein [Burkholderia contaminans]|uniref:PIN domain-containing protein n=1 Tax=Burkholderia contaminans TaxID=488447 RepID=UPI001C2E1B93|nr:PIN domain-containing protein [Burkholderia contaminans]